MEQLTQANLAQKQKLETSRGQVLVFALMTVLVILIVTVGIISLVSREYIQSSFSYKNTESLSLAESGVDYAIKQLGSDVNYTGTSVPVALGNGEFEITVTGTSSQKTVIGTGYIPNKTNYKSKKMVKTVVNISSTNISFHYAVQIGNEGITMKSNSTINGNAYSNGNITGTSNSVIYGDAYAVGTISAETKPHVTGTRHPGSPASEMPTIDYSYWKNAAVAGSTYNGNYSIGGNSSETWGTKKIIGDLTLDSNATLTVTGPIWVTGNLALNGNTILYLDESFGSNGTVIIVDGTITLSSNSQLRTTHATPAGYLLLVTTNTTDNAITFNSNSANGLCYALDGGITFNSNAHAVSVIGKRLILNSNATLTYDQGLVDANFSSGPGGGWEIQAGSWQEL